MKNIRDEFYSTLYPLYKTMLAENTYNNICTFCIQWGENFPVSKNSGLVFVGKAVNRWITNTDEVDLLFGDSDDNIFALEDQMKWVVDREGNHNGYNTKRSAFWRVVKRISNYYYPHENWYSHVAWTNLCKLAPYDGGNPNQGLYDQQLSSAQEILKHELEILSPRFVIMLTSGWEHDFISYFNDNNDIDFIETVDWDEYQTRICKINNTFFILSKHPQGKNENNSFNSIVKLIDKYK